jgi:hypothetical protein
MDWTRGSQTLGCNLPGGNAVGPLSWREFVWGPYLFWTKYERKNKHFGRHFAWLKYFIYQLLSVPVLAPNNKQHILSPAKVRNVCYSPAELHVKSVYLNLFGRTRAWSSWNSFRWAQSMSLRISVLCLVKLSIDACGRLLLTRQWFPTFLKRTVNFFATWANTAISLNINVVRQHVTLSHINFNTNPHWFTNVSTVMEFYNTFRAQRPSSGNIWTYPEVINASTIF